MIKKIALIFSCLMPVLCFANDTGVLLNQDDFVSSESIIERAPDDTQCATAVFADALRASAESGAIDESAHEADMQSWIYSVFGDKTVLEQVLNCPEIANADDDDFIKFIPIQYDFPNGRQIILNYETTPTVLKQKLVVSEKRDLPMGPASADLTAGDAIWVNVDPAWYGIMVVEHDALKDFVGPDKNNTISLKYIYDNADKLYPSGYSCTDKSAIANDHFAINEAVKVTVGIENKETGEKDSNDYYVAGDVNLGWIMYAEIAADVVLTVATMGVGTAVSGTLKGVSAMKNIHGIRRVIDGLIDSSKAVKEFVAIETKVAKSTDRLNDVRKALQAGEHVPSPQELKNVSVAEQNLQRAQTKLQKAVKANKGKKEIEKLRSAEKTAQQELNRYRNIATGKKLKAEDVLKLREEELTLKATIETLEKDLENARKADKTGDIEKYEDASKTLKDTMEYARTLRGLRMGKVAKRGNVAVRALHFVKGVKAAMRGTQTLNKGAKIARAGKLSEKAKDWLFHTTRMYGAHLGKVEATGGALYGALKFVGGMYDYTETSTGDFTNNIEFKPLLLLSADDIDGQDNVVNYGMWLMWMGDSMSAVDDDAAYLQAMDFAAKFHEDLTTEQNETSAPCNVDIFVVRPIIRNPGDMNQELYYLIMNDEPWTTAD